MHRYQNRRNRNRNRPDTDRVWDFRSSFLSILFYFFSFVLYHGEAFGRIRVESDRTTLEGAQMRKKKDKKTARG